MANPLFSPHSMYWRVNREWLIALAGPRAVLLELAHPAVAAGVVQHSDYRGDPFGRLYRTMKTMTEISFGAEEEMRVALKHFHKCHARVNGDFTPSPVTEPALSEAKGHSSPDPCPLSPYHARDPHLQFWVLATLIDSVLRVYEKFVTPLTFADKGAYYDDCARLAEVFGISRAVIPDSYNAFHAYMDAKVYGDALSVTQNARDVVAALFAPTLRGRATQLFSFASIGMLPARLRDEYGFEWNEARGKNLERMAKFARRARPWIPNLFAVHPKAQAMERQMKMSLLSAR